MTAEGADVVGGAGDDDAAGGMGCDSGEAINSRRVVGKGSAAPRGLMTPSMVAPASARRRERGGVTLRAGATGGFDASPVVWNGSGAAWFGWTTAATVMPAADRRSTRGFGTSRVASSSSGAGSPVLFAANGSGAA